MMKFRTKYERRRVISPRGGASLTDQQYKDDCSIEGIVKRYGILQQPLPTPFGTSADVSEMGDFAEVMQKVMDAKERFLDLPSDIRARFGHDPEAFYRFLADKNNADEAVKLGLLEVVQPDKDPVEVLERIAVNTTPKEVATNS